MTQRVSAPKQAQNIRQLLAQIKSEKKQIRSTLDQPELLDEMKQNVTKLCDTMKHSIDKGAVITHGSIEGIDELCPEVSKHISILTVSVRIINYGLCECAANQLLAASLSVLDAIHNFFEFIQRSNASNSDHKTDDEKHKDDGADAVNTQLLTTLVGVVWTVTSRLYDSIYDSFKTLK